MTEGPHAVTDGVLAAGEDRRRANRRLGARHTVTHGVPAAGEAHSLTYGLATPRRLWLAATEPRASGGIPTINGVLYAQVRFPGRDGTASARECGEINALQDVIERAMAAMMLLVSLPVMVLIAIILRLDSPGPALFRQWRVGKEGKLFRFMKFRTMYADARERFSWLYAYQYTAEEVERLYFKMPDDPRVTRMGRWLRQSTLDELPNFWNVLMGDMRLVGPRPEIPEMLPYYEGESLLKFRVQPGITGIAQISGRGRLSFRQTVQYDIEYVRRRTCWFDVKIVLLTLYRAVCRDGAF